MQLGKPRSKPLPQGDEHSVGRRSCARITEVRAHVAAARGAKIAAKENGGSLRMSKLEAAVKQLADRVTIGHDIRFAAASACMGESHSASAFCSPGA